MVCFIARFKVKAGKETEAADCINEMVAAVEAHEPGTLAYRCHESQRDPLERVFYEVYADEAAKDNHMETPHFERLCGFIGDVFDAEYGVQIEDLRPVAGFGRAMQG